MITNQWWQLTISYRRTVLTVTTNCTLDHLCTRVIFVLPFFIPIMAYALRELQQEMAMSKNYLMFTREF